MTKNHARLQRRPFLTPIWLIVSGAGLAACFLGFLVWVWATAGSTTVVVVRHAEKAVDGGTDNGMRGGADEGTHGGTDPPLAPAGVARAALLSRMFGDAPGPARIDAIYVSPALRNRMTAAPLAARLGLTPIVSEDSDARSLARRVLREHSGARVLVVGHSDTVPEIVEALSGVRDLPPIGDDDYGTMYIVTVPRIGRANVLRVTY